MHTGRMLASTLSRYAGRDDVMVLVLPRGGVPVANEMTGLLHVPLDVFVVRNSGFLEMKSRRWRDRI